MRKKSSSDCIEFFNGSIDMDAGSDRSGNGI